MQDSIFFDAMKEGLWLSVTISVPILLAALASGLLVGLFQALTSIQEMTLTFVPKLAAIVVAFWISMEFMTLKLVSFYHTSFEAYFKE